jgi:uncharacterized phage-like protein YoqJ
MILSVTGHRPDKLGGYGEKNRKLLIEYAMESLDFIDADYTVEKVLTGMALGWDQAIAEACIRLDRPFVAVIPFYEQPLRWPEESRKRYKELLNCAEKVICPSNSMGYAVYKMQLRNEYMVDQSSYVLALWNGSDGGTKNCVEYARKKNVPIVNCWRDWLTFIETKQGEI